VLWNLLSNAVKFTPRGGTIRVTARREKSSVEIEVADTGIGIREELLPHVFERFWQADAGVTRAHGGLGIGLALVRHLVELHGGTVAVSSAGPNRGASFTVRLPIAPARRPEPAVSAAPRRERESQPAGNGASIAGLNVLVVDDEQDSRELLAEILSHHHAHVETASSATEALEAIETTSPDVIVSDIGMPGMDGFELIRRVRARDARQGGKTPAVALTAYARAEDRAQAIAAGFDLHVSKPIGSDELAAAVARAAHRA
jgi:CheY-like chemotaxis protein